MIFPYGFSFHKLSREVNPSGIGCRPENLGDLMSEQITRQFEKASERSLIKGIPDGSRDTFFIVFSAGEGYTLLRTDDIRVALPGSLQILQKLCFMPEV